MSTPADLRQEAIAKALCEAAGMDPSDRVFGLNHIDGRMVDVGPDGAFCWQAFMADARKWLAAYDALRALTGGDVGDVVSHIEPPS